jgi:2-keto-4-pentenoate hydratase/2-oxohepta-3-ene-1,7-dioic acid hydratase in catechol pathway
VSEADALSYVAGYATGNDFTACDLQNDRVQWMIGKAIDQFAPVGPYMVTAEQIDPDTELVGHVNPRAERSIRKLVITSRRIRRGHAIAPARREFASWLG